MAVRVRTSPQMPAFTTVTWDCGSCGWSSEPDGFVGAAESHELESTRPPAPDPIEPEEPPDDAVAALTEHEVEVVTLLGSGLSNQEIADRLSVSINTVKATLGKAYRKMHVSSRTQAQLWAIRHRLFDPMD
jgi:DNA-binding NarL/FixJ family response regulator